MRIYLLSLLVLIFLSCKTTSKAQNKSNSPLEDITWLKELKTSFEKDSGQRKAMIIQYTYNKETVFLIENCFQCPDGMSTVYNSKKKVICEFGGIIGKNTCPDFSEKATNEKVIYKSFE